MRSWGRGAQTWASPDASALLGFRCVCVWRSSNGFPIYVHVPVGTGKTATVNACCRNERACMLSGVRDFLDRMPSLHSIGEDTVVVDDVSLIVEARSQGYAKYWLSRAPFWHYRVSC